jgi:hypothetical protein
MGVVDTEADCSPPVAGCSDASIATHLHCATSGSGETGFQCRGSQSALSSLNQGKTT